MAGREPGHSPYLSGSPGHAAVRRPGDEALRASAPLAAARDDRTEQLPALAGELLHLHLFDWVEVLVAGVDRDAGQQHRVRYILEARGLLHHVLAREIVAGPLEHFMQRLRHRVAIHREAGGLVAVREILVHK